MLYIGSIEDFIAEDKGTDYNSIMPVTLSAVCDEFYRRHKDVVESIIGKDNNNSNLYNKNPDLQYMVFNIFVLYF